MADKYDKPIVDRQKCIGCGSCMVVAPEAFELDNQNISAVKEAWCDATDEKLLQAAQGCPVQAITLLRQKAPAF